MPDSNMTSPEQPNATERGHALVGIVGAGQLARMTLQAAIPLDVSIRLLAAKDNDGAATIWRDVIVGAPDDVGALTELAETTEVVTFDHELVPVPTLAALEAAGHAMRPSSATMALAQNKRLQRERHAALGLHVPAPRYRPIRTPSSRSAIRTGGRWWRSRPRVDTTVAVSGCCAIGPPRNNSSLKSGRTRASPS
ncbi:MAG: hypothetical protein R2845_02210 [Thermomicrobiales bacterium]